jgi:hypothetical protein
MDEMMIKRKAKKTMEEKFFNKIKWVNEMK